MSQSHAPRRPGPNVTKFLCSLVSIAIAMSIGFVRRANEWDNAHEIAGPGQALQGRIKSTMLTVKENVMNTKVYCSCTS